MPAVRHLTLLISLLVALLVPTMSVAAAPPESAGPNGETGQYLIRLKPGASPRGVAAGVPGMSDADITHEYSAVFNGFAARIPAQAAEALRRNPQVEVVMEDVEVQLDEQTTPTGIERIRATSSPIGSIDGNDDRVDVDVAVIDSGSGPHGDLNVVGGTDCTGSGSYNDQNGHGSHVAGTIGALDNGSGVVGVAPGARIWSVKVLDAEGSGYGSWILCGIDWVTGRAGTIEVANMSLGGTGLSDDGNCGYSAGDLIHQAICSSIDAGVTYTVAAGNDGVDASNFFPASYDEVVTVSALADSDGQPGGHGASTWAGADDSLASFSNYGADVDVIAPGVDILSTVPGGYAYYSGTSMASPHAAGAAALYLVANPQASPAQVRQGLITTGSGTGWSGDRDGFKEPLIDVSSFGQGPDPDIGTPMWVSNLELSHQVVRDRDRLYIRVYVASDSGPVSGAAVSIDLLQPDSSTRSGTATTSSGGYATLIAYVNGPGTYTVTVTGVTKDGYSYDPDRNVETSEGMTIGGEVATHDAEVVSVSAPATSTQGDIVTVNAQVRNSGNGSDSISVTLSESPGGHIETKTVSLAAGASTTVSFIWATNLDTTAGEHVLTVSALVADDSDTSNDSATATTTIQPPPVDAGTPMWVSDVQVSHQVVRDRDRLYIRVYVDSDSAPVAGATVAVELRQPDGSTRSGTAMTSSGGYATLAAYVDGPGTYTVTVTDVTKDGYSYDPGRNVETAESVTIS